jgi:hypothetical protein
MRFLRLTVVSLVLPVFLFVSGAVASVARAESPSASARLALAKDPTPARPSMVDTPANTRMSDAPAPAEPESGHSAWWVWAVIAAGVAGVAALVVTTSGKDPGCPSDRVCH